MGLMLKLVLAYMGISLVLKKAYEHFVFFLLGNWKYRLLNALADFVYYGKNIGVSASLSLDNPAQSVLEQRLRGHAYLKSKLEKLNSKDKNTADDVCVDIDAAETPPSCHRQLAEKMVDCRFAMRKLLMPLMQELEFTPINFVSEVKIQKDQMLQVSTPNTENMLYVGNDAVYTLGVSSFYAPVQEEINRRMSLTEDGDNLVDKTSTLRFAPCALNPGLEKNMNLILGLTGMDQVRFLECINSNSHYLLFR